MKLNYFLFFFLMLSAFSGSNAIASPAGPGDWILMGATYAPVTYNLYYYKLAQINNTADQYATIIDVSVQGDPNFFDKQASYQIRIDKITQTPGRFDGLEIRCISGSPAAATFYVYNNALWVRANAQWGNMYYRTVGDFIQSPLNTAPFGQTTTAPTGYAVSTGSYGLKCDFDNNLFYKLPYQDQFGNMIIAGKTGIGVDTPSAPLHIANGLQQIRLATGTNNSGYRLDIGLNDDGINFSTNSGSRGFNFRNINGMLMSINSFGNVGIGTNNSKGYKLAVEGTLAARRVKVTQELWADYVFQDDYVLPTLYYVENYIREHKHLPGIPSTKDVAAEGLDLGDINRLLLQKMEEMTLYMIELKKENQQQREDIEYLKKLVNK